MSTYSYILFSVVCNVPTLFTYYIPRYSGVEGGGCVTQDSITEHMRPEMGCQLTTYYTITVVLTAKAMLTRMKSSSARVRAAAAMSCRPRVSVCHESHDCCTTVTRPDDRHRTSSADNWPPRACTAYCISYVWLVVAPPPLPPSPTTLTLHYPRLLYTE